MIPLLIAGIVMHQNPAEDKIKRAASVYLEAVRTYDPVTLDKILDKDYIEVSPLGEVDERARVISFYKIPEGTKAPQPKSIVLEEWTFRWPAKDIALTTAKETLKLDGKSGEVTMIFRTSMVWHKTKGQWKLASQHVNAVRAIKP